jgi:hypothetical protein
MEKRCVFFAGRAEFLHTCYMSLGFRGSDLTICIIYTPKAEGTKEDLWRDFLTRETGTGQQVAQFLDCYVMMMMMILYSCHRL